MTRSAATRFGGRADGGVRNRTAGRALLRPRLGGIFTVALPCRSPRACPILVRGLPWRPAVVMPAARLPRLGPNALGSLPTSLYAGLHVLSFKQLKNGAVFEALAEFQFF
jgi:hypothetical protein